MDWDCASSPVPGGRAAIFTRAYLLEAPIPNEAEKKWGASGPAARQAERGRSGENPEHDIADGENGLLVDFFAAEGLARRVAEVLAEPDRVAPRALRATTGVALVHALSRSELPPAGF